MSHKIFALVSASSCEAEIFLLGWTLIEFTSLSDVPTFNVNNNLLRWWWWWWWKVWNCFDISPMFVFTNTKKVYKSIPGREKSDQRGDKRMLITTPTSTKAILAINSPNNLNRSFSTSILQQIATNYFNFKFPIVNFFFYFSMKNFFLESIKTFSFICHALKLKHDLISLKKCFEQQIKSKVT